MIETTLRKRKAMFKGEVGLFPTNEMEADDIKPLATDSDVLVKLSSPKNLQLQKYMWTLATKVAECSDRCLDKDDAMEALKRGAKFVKFVRNPKSGQMELVTKSMARLSNEALQRLANRMIFVVVNEIVPGLKAQELRDELMQMIGERNAGHVGSETGGDAKGENGKTVPVQRDGH